MIRSSRHSIKFANTDKRVRLRAFLAAYRVAVAAYVDYLWDNEVIWGGRILNVSQNLLDCPSMLHYNSIAFPTTLSARALSAAATQACGMVKASLEKPRRRLWKIERLKIEGKEFGALAAKVENTRLIKPGISKDIRAELNSNCVDVKMDENSFDYFLRLKAIGKEFGLIKLPIRGTKHSNRWKARGERMNSFLVSHQEISFRWNVEVEKNAEGEVLGLDQGISTLLSFSDRTVSGRCPHGHDLASITRRLSRQKKGSAAHHRTQIHRTNYIGWSLNRLNWPNIKQINVEDISDLNRGQSKNRYLSHWTPGIILDKLQQKSEEHGVRVELIDCAYRSQRCSQCGWVQKSNRKGKAFHCVKCRHYDDADLNAAANNALDLPVIPKDFRLRRMNLEGFYFNEGQEFIVPDTKQGKDELKT